MDFSWLGKINTLELFLKLMIITLFFGMIITGVVVLLKSLSKFKGGLRIKGKDGGEIDITGAETNGNPSTGKPNIVQALEVRDYLNNLRHIFDGVKDDIRARLTENGWNKMSKIELMDYFDRAVKDHDIKLTNYLNDYYYYNAIVSRVALYDWNERIKDAVEDKYLEMYATLDRITSGAYKEIYEKEKKLEEAKKNKQLCNPNIQLCPNTSAIIDQVIDLFLDKTVRIKRKCMVEVERYLDDIRQMYYSHYLTIYKRTALNKGD